MLKLLHHVRQKATFLVVGTLAFALDAGLLWLLNHHGMPPWLARGLSLSVAVVVAWLANRRVTFGLTSLPHWREFWRYLSLAGSVAVLNYALYLGVLATGIVTHPVLATALSTVACMAVSFVGMQIFVFRPKKP